MEKAQSLTREIILKKKEEYPLFQEGMFKDWEEGEILVYRISNNFERRYWQSKLTVDVELYSDLFRGPENSKDPKRMPDILGMISLFEEFDPIRIWTEVEAKADWRSGGYSYISAPLICAEFKQGKVKYDLFGRENEFYTQLVFPSWTNWVLEHKDFNSNLVMDKHTQRYMWLHLFTHPNESLKGG
jgi:hypothetical protein